jgi:hypothetical protein
MRPIQKTIFFLTFTISPSSQTVTIHGTTTFIRKSSQQAVCRFFEALPFAHVGAVPASQAACSNKFSLMCKHNAQIHYCKLP